MSLPVLTVDTNGAELSDREFLDSLKAHLAGTLAAIRDAERDPLSGGEEACRGYSDAMDDVLRALHGRARARFLAKAPDIKYRLSVIAVGGYGRGELCPRSDVDLLFLHHYKVDRYVEAMTEWMLYPLWDLGLEVGHSVRNVKETVRMAAADDSVRTALLDYRFVAGHEPFFHESRKDIERFLFYSDADRFIDTKIKEMRKRHAKFGETVFLLEPNIKEGKGGLRDLQTAIWVARIKYKSNGLVELRNKGVLTTQTIRAIRHIQDYLFRVRNELHFLAGKKADVLTFEYQQQLAEIFRYRTFGRNIGLERFMRSYYLHAVSAAHLADELVEEVDRFLPEATRKPFFFLSRKTVSGDGILYKGMLHVRDRQAFQKDPVRILEFFRTQQRTRSHLSVQAKKTVQRALPLVGTAFREDPHAANLFLSILSEPVHLRTTLLSMNECRFLGRYIPDFAPLFCKVLHDIYHVYTVDIHSIRAASELAEMETASSRTPEEEEFLRIHRLIPRKDLLNLALLCHDIGKGKGGGHSQIGAQIVAQLGARMGLSPEETSDLVFLVEQHLLMAHTSQRRDLHDLDLILSFAAAVGTPARLDLLYLLTIMDLRAVGPEVWTQWKAMLLAELYEKTRNVLEHGPLKRPFEEQARRRREKVRDGLSDFPPAEVDRFLSRFDDRYFLGTPDGRFAPHLKLLRAFDGQGRPSAATATDGRSVAGRMDAPERPGAMDGAGAADGQNPAVEFLEAPDAAASEIVIVCPDQRGLFAKIAGTLSANGLNILNASVATSSDGVALDTFHVTYMRRSLRENVKKDRVTADLVAVLKGEADVRTLLAERKVARFTRDKVSRYRPTKVVFDNTVSTRYTVVDIFTYDRIGLLYDITSTITSLGIDIALSKISTKADQVADVFYLVDRDGGKIVSPGRQEEVRAALLESIGP